MLRKTVSVILVILLLFTGCAKISGSPQSKKPQNLTTQAIFRGVEGYGTVSAHDVMIEDAEVYRFEIDGEIVVLPIKITKGYYIQNHLMEGYNYDIVIEDGHVVSAEFNDELPVYDPVVKAVPGLRTLKNFLVTAFEPMGTTLYVWEGNYNWQSNGSGVQSTTIGVPGTWVDFYNSQNEKYKYADDYDRAHSYFPYEGYNEYYYAGADCSGYVGWIVYNVMNTESGGNGFVVDCDDQGYMLAKDYGFGTLDHNVIDSEEDPIRPGDMVSTPSHIWICVGKCDDGSVVVLHSTVTPSVSGHQGGGVQLSAVNPDGDSKDCDAYRLAAAYTEKYFPDWISRYPVVMKTYHKYFEFDRSYFKVGRFRWFTDGDAGLSDPDGYSEMSASEVLADIFGEI